MAAIVHGGAFGKKHVAKCGKAKGKIFNDGEQCVSYMAGMSQVTCPECIKKHKPGKR